MRVIGIDPGTVKAGYGVVEETAGKLVAVAFGTVRAPPKADFPRRLLAIHDGLLAVIREHRPDEAAVEEVYQGKGAQSSLKIGEGRGVHRRIPAGDDQEGGHRDRRGAQDPGPGDDPANPGPPRRGPARGRRRRPGGGHLPSQPEGHQAI